MQPPNPHISGSIDRYPKQPYLRPVCHISILNIHPLQPYIAIPGLDPMTGATLHRRDTAAPPQTIMSPHVRFYDLLCPDMNSVLVLVLEPGCGCQLSQWSRCLCDDLVLPHDHISPAPGLTALVNCVLRQSKNTQNNVHDSRNNRSLYISISSYLGPPVF